MRKVLFSLLAICPLTAALASDGAAVDGGAAASAPAPAASSASKSHAKAHSKGKGKAKAGGQPANAGKASDPGAKGAKKEPPCEPVKPCPIE
jgi:hypothetical protein